MADQEHKNTSEQPLPPYERRYPIMTEEQQTRLCRNFKEIQDFQELHGLTEKGPAIGG